MDKKLEIISMLKAFPQRIKLVDPYVRKYEDLNHINIRGDFAAFRAASEIGRKQIEETHIKQKERFKPR